MRMPLGKLQQEVQAHSRLEYAVKYRLLEQFTATYEELPTENIRNGSLRDLVQWIADTT